MPRLALSNLLIGVAIIALWLATLQEFPGAGQIRNAILFGILLTACISAFYYRGSRRAFWLGFFVAMLLLGLNVKLIIFIPDFWEASLNWTEALLNNQIIEAIHFDAVAGSMQALLILGVSTVIGLIAARIYDDSTNT